MKLPGKNIRVTAHGFIINENCHIPFGYNRLIKEEARAYGKRVDEAFKANPSKLSQYLVKK